MNTSNEFLQDLMDVTSTLPEAERIEVLRECIASALSPMDRATVLLVRRQLDLALAEERDREAVMRRNERTAYCS